MGRLANVRFCFASLFVLNAYFGACQTGVEDDIDLISANLKDALITLGKNASRPQPKFGLESAIDPLVAVAPLRYLHEGDLLKLRLQLNNVTLEGLSTLAVQEVSFNLPEGFALRHSFASGEGPSSHDADDDERGNKDADVSEYDYYDEVEDDEYEVLSHHTGSENSKHEATKSDHDYSAIPRREHLVRHHDNSFVPKEDEKDLPYLDDFGTRKLIDEANEDADDYEVYARDDSAERDSEDHSREYDYDYSGYKRNKRSLHASSDRTSRHSKRARHSHKLHASPKLHFNFSSTISPSKMLTIGKAELHRSKETVSGFEREPLRHHRNTIDPKRAKKNKRTVNMLTPDSALTLPDPPTLPPGSLDLKRVMLVPANVKVSFSNMKIKAQYVIRGRAGGVFTFKEQGKLVLTIPNVFLTSQFNVTVIPEVKGLRHWKKNNRRNHLRVQKVRSRLSLEVPKLSLIPASRPSEWVRKQLQEKMEELGKGVGKRDGAIRLLLRHWARLLRRLVTKVSRQSWSDVKKTPE